jgi:hypothetical protein
MRTTQLIAALLAVMFGAGCASPPLIGYWESDKRLGNDRKNKLEIYEGFTGTAKIYATPANDPNTWILFEFEVVWEDFEVEFALDLDCEEGPCEGKINNFDMDCEVIEQEDDSEVMDCDGDKKWKDYPFQWQRDV